MAHPGGRPTDYSEKMIEKSKEYIDSCKDKDEMVVVEKQANGNEKLVRKVRANFPSIEGLAKYLKVSRFTVYEWAGKYEQFSNILNDIKNEQVERLINNGLDGTYNPLIAKLVLAKHGYKDQLGLSGEGEGEAIKLEGKVTDAIDLVYGTTSNTSTSDSRKKS